MDREEARNRLALDVLEPWATDQGEAEAMANAVLDWVAGMTRGEVISLRLNLKSSPHATHPDD